MKNLLIAIILLLSGSMYAQKYEKEQYLSFQTGLLINNANTTGIRTFIEYQKDFNKNWFYGVSFDHSNYFSRSMTDYYPTPRNLDIVNFNTYYKLHLYKEKVFWTLGLGLGAFHAYWKKENDFGVVLNADVTLNIRLSKKVILQTMIIPVLAPFNRFYISPQSINNDGIMRAFSAIPIGIKIKL